MRLGYASVKAEIGKRFELHSGQQKIASMEGLRGFSALLVFFVHFYAEFGLRVQQSAVHGLFYFLAVIGHCGVDIFFALSGYIIYGLLLRKPFGYWGFICRRIDRLYPVFTALFFIYLGLSLAVPAYSKLPHAPFSAAAWLIANFLMLPGIFPIVAMITPAWSLSYELCFYLTLPLAMQWLRIYAWPHSRRTVFWVCVCVLHLVLASAGLLQHGQMIMFGCGILMRETMAAKDGMKTGSVAAGNALALAGFAAVLVFIGFENSSDISNLLGPVRERSLITSGLLFVSTLALGHYTLRGEGLLTKLFSVDWLRWFGNMSYSFYLTHGIMLHFLRMLLSLLHMPDRLSSSASLLLCLGAIAITVLGSAVVFLCVEKRFSFSAPAVRAGESVTVVSGTFHRAMDRTISPNGILMKNTHLQEPCSLNHPPSTGPIAAVIDVKPDHVPMARPRSFSGKLALIRARLPGTSNAPPNPL